MEEGEEVIKELGPGRELDYLKILKALNEIKFPVGKNLLISFLIGDIKNQSVKKNELYDLYNFGAMKKYSEGEIRGMIDNLIANSMIDSSALTDNKFAVVLGITSRGAEELMNPSLHKKKISNNFEVKETRITQQERLLFSELDFFLRGHNDEQKKAIISRKSKILCLAGAGSGKTSVLVKRIEFLITYCSELPGRTLAITFTRKARREMEARLAKAGIRDVAVETFNSFSEKMLLKHAKLIYKIPTRVMSYSDKIFLMNFALDYLGLDIASIIDKYFSEKQKNNKEASQLSNIFINDCFSVLEYFKSKGQEIYDFSKDVSDKENEEMAHTIWKIVKSLDEHMKMQGLRDYVDQILDTIKLFNEHNELIPEFDNILVDEYQDVNAMQINLLDLLVNKVNSNLFVVGDPRKSIFGWRGSDINYILKFEEKYKDCEIIHLVKNYRSGGKIVEFMNHSIRDLKVPDLESCNTDDSGINILNFSSEEDEHRSVLERISGFLKGGVNGDEIFVLARTNRQLGELSKKLKEAGIAHVVKTDEVKRPVIGNVGDVTLATIHAIKGLEAKIVFVIGCNELNFPCKASDHPVIEMVKMGMQGYDKEEEEKRLFYVAISRAKEKLFLSYSGKKPTYFINPEMSKMLNKWF
jgi:DNA helicase II / ATP-dependent DNA helicase PcrA